MLSKILFAVTLATAAVAQSTTSSAAVSVSTSTVPGCAVSCAISASTASGCGVTDYKCLCTNSTYQSSFYQCQQQACSASDLQAALQFGQQACAQAGYPINTAAVPSGVSSASGSSATGSSSASGSSSSSQMTSATMTSASSSAAAVTSAASQSAASQSAAPTSKNGAVHVQVSIAAMALVGAAAVVAL